MSTESHVMYKFRNLYFPSLKVTLVTPEQNRGEERKKEKTAHEPLNHPL